MIRSISTVLSLGIGACMSRQAPGTRPGDMSAQAHIEECRRYARLADAKDERGREIDEARDTVTPPYLGYEDRETAKQHGRAAKQVDPNAPDCP